MLTSLSPVASPAGIRATKASGTTLSPAATRQWGPMRRFERWHPATERCATQPSAAGSAPSHWRPFAGGRLAHRGSPEGMLLRGQSSAAEGTFGPWQLRKRTQHAEVIRLVFSRALVGGTALHCSMSSRRRQRAMRSLIVGVCGVRSGHTEEHDIRWTNCAFGTRGARLR